MSDAQTNTTIIVNAKPEKSVVAAFFLTLLLGPLGLLYATITGGIIMIILALIIGAVTFGLGSLVTWPVAIVWGVIAAAASKKGQPKTA